MLLLCFSLLVTSCSPTISATGTSQSPSGSNAYPIETQIPLLNAFSTTYPAPLSQNTPEAQQQQPTRDPSLGVIKGSLSIQTSEGVRPVKNAILYLAQVMKDDKGIERVVSMDRITSPRTTTDENGYFEFINVPPGKYGLVLDTILNLYLLNNPETGGDMLFEVNEATITDVGSLVYDTLPVRE